ncbi:hypothetical protein [Caballeronia sordidicola]|uniref:Kynurenine formamidase, bacterial n=1 Tax=Caballeronia sordidicola TaxID=196367 RepID=A0A242MLR1_CABSO|nr:hypothetical protein [Caballeronia sordidicola]OTP71685.1 Kynurenine formamidase, bacterial [Caballeronia sordidicola]
MVWRYKNRWFRRWLVLIVFWAVPVMIVAANEIREQLAYDSADLSHTLSTWSFTDTQRAQPAARRCHGPIDEARSAGCPPDMLAAKTALDQQAIAQYATRKGVLFGYLWTAFIGYWVVPAITLFVLGAIIGVIRRSLRHPMKKNDVQSTHEPAHKTTHIAKP